MTNLQFLKKKKITPLIIFLSIIFSSIGNSTLATAEGNDVDYNLEHFSLQQGMNRMYLVNLNVNDTWIITCTSKFEGKFNLYIYDQRPTSDDYLNNHTNYPNLGSPLIAYNETPIEVYSYDIDANVNYISLNYNVTESKLHYVEIRLVDGGPDSFILSSTVNGQANEIQAYFIPYIAGFELKYLFASSIGSSLFILFIYRNKKKN